MGLVMNQKPIKTEFSHFHKESFHRSFTLTSFGIKIAATKHFVSIYISLKNNVFYTTVPVSDIWDHEKQNCLSQNNDGFDDTKIPD